MQKKSPDPSLTRKNFIKQAGLATAGLGLGAAACNNISESSTGAVSGANTGKSYKWNMVTTWPPNFPVLGEGCNLFAEWISEMSGGQLSISVYGGGELIPALEAFDAVSSRTADMMSGASYYWAGKSQATQFFGAVPFGLNAQQMNAWLYFGGGLDLWKETYAKFNLLPFPGGNTGVQMGGWFNREINSIEDIKGLKMRMPGLGGKILERAGGTAVLSAGGEIYMNLERGVIDATEWIGPYHDYLMGFHEISKYYYYPGWHEPSAVLELTVNKLSFEELPAHLQRIVETAALRLNMWILSEFEAKNAEYLQKIQDESDAEVRQFPDEVLNALQTITREVLKEITEQDPLSKKIYTSYSNFQSQINNWAEVSEKQFYARF